MFFPSTVWPGLPLPMQRAFNSILAALARKFLGPSHLASPPFQCLRSNMPAEPCHRRPEQTAAHLSVHHSPLALGVAKVSYCVATNCYCESVGLSNIVSKALAEVCELPSNEKQQHQPCAKYGDQQSSQILNIVNTPYNQQADPSSIKA